MFRLSVKIMRSFLCLICQNAAPSIHFAQNLPNLPAFCSLLLSTYFPIFLLAESMHPYIFTCNIQLAVITGGVLLIITSHWYVLSSLEVLNDEARLVLMRFVVVGVLSVKFIFHLFEVLSHHYSILHVFYW